MELDELKAMWQSNDVKLEKSLSLNEQNMDLLLSKKVASKLKPIYRQRVIECIFHSIAIVLLIAFLIKNLKQFPYAISAIVLMAFYMTTFLNALKQIMLIKNIDFNKDLATMQSALIMLQTHIINYAKLSILFIPAFLAFPTIISKVIRDFNIKAFANFDIIEKSNGSWWTVQMVAFVILIPLGIWFYKKVSYKNMNLNWVKNFIQTTSGTRISKALEILKELQRLKIGKI